MIDHKQLTGTTFLLSLIVGILLLPTAPVPVEQEGNKGPTRQELYEQICGQDTTLRQDTTTPSSSAGEAPPAPIQFRNLTCTFTNTTITTHVTLKNTGTFQPRDGLGSITAGIKSNQGTTSFTVNISPSYIHDLQANADIRGAHAKNTTITLTSTTGTLQCPNNHATLTFTIPRTLNKTHYPNSIQYFSSEYWIEDSINCTPK